MSTSTDVDGGSSTSSSGSIGSSSGYGSQNTIVKPFDAAAEKLAAAAAGRNQNQGQHQQKQPGGEGK
jgi:hypothetical protein